MSVNISAIHSPWDLYYFTYGRDPCTVEAASKAWQAMDLTYNLVKGLKAVKPLNLEASDYVNAFLKHNKDGKEPVSMLEFMLRKVFKYSSDYSFLERIDENSSCECLKKN